MIIATLASPNHYNHRELTGKPEDNRQPTNITDLHVFTHYISLDRVKKVEKPRENPAALVVG